MTLDLSNFGRKFCGHSGILELMDDLGQVMSGSRPCLMLGGGNPAAIPESQALWRRRMADLLADRARFDAMLCNYDTPQGRPALIDAVVEFFNRTCGWGISAANVAITNGSQNAFFYLFNMLAGDFPDGRKKRILVPLMPEYIGYADQGMSPGIFRSCRPSLSLLESRSFKYHVDFDRLAVSDDVAAMAVSRPTNPTGNVLTDDEITRLAALAKVHGIYLIIDNAYGAPFPNIMFTEVTSHWQPHLIMTFSLSKLGLPGTRTGIVIASEEVVRALSAINAIAELATNNIGAEIAAPLIRDGEMASFARECITPFYGEKAAKATAWLLDCLPEDLPVYIHKCEGALFLWIWCKDLPITSRQLYENLKRRKVVVVSGHYFFYGLEEEWPHQHECLRINYSQPEGIVRAGLKIIAEEIERAYRA